jgi:hypothetical protein
MSTLGPIKLHKAPADLDIQPGDTVTLYRVQGEFHKGRWSDFNIPDFSTPDEAAAFADRMCESIPTRVLELQLTATRVLQAS